MARPRLAVRPRPFGGHTDSALCGPPAAISHRSPRSLVRFALDDEACAGRVIGRDGVWRRVEGALPDDVGRALRGLGR